LDTSEFNKAKRPSSTHELGRFPDRLKELIGSSSVRSFAIKCGLSEAVLRSYLRGNTFPTLDRLELIATSGEVRAGWLATGEGPRERDDQVCEAAAEYFTDREMLSPDEYVLVPRYDVTASAGPGALVSSEQVVDHLAFKRKWIKRLGLDGGQLALITAVGDSMEPTIREGFLLLVDLRQHQVGGDAIYILRFDHELIAKRLQRMFDGGVKIKSDNPAYDEQLVPGDQVAKLNIIGKVVWGGGRM